MQAPLSQPEYWILDAVVPEVLPFFSLNEKTVELWHNRKGHGLSQIKLIETLAHLFNLDMLTVGYYVNFYLDWSKRFTPSYSEIELLLHDENVWYGLTAKGGEVWEELSNPNWDIFIAMGFEWACDNEWSVTSANRQLIDSYITSPELQERLAPSKMEVTVLKPWQATYWKQLSLGYQVRYRVTPPYNETIVAEPEPNWYKNRLFHDPLPEFEPRRT